LSIVIVRVLRIHEHVQPSSFDALRPEWDALVERSPDSTIFQTWEWLSTWWAHFGNGRLVLLAAQDGDELVGLAPLFLAGGLPRRLCFIGDGISDYPDFIVAQDRVDEFLDALAAYLDERGRWDLVDLCDVRNDRGVAFRFTPARFARHAIPGTRTPHIKLPPTREQYLASFTSNQRKNLRKDERELKEAFQVAFEATPARDQLEIAFGELIELHQATWRTRGEPGNLSDPRVLAFHRALIGPMHERGWLRLWRLKLDGRTCAAVYTFSYRRINYAYIMGADPNLRDYSVLKGTLARGFEDELARGTVELDLLRGNEPYKTKTWHADTSRYNERRLYARPGRTMWFWPARVRRATLRAVFRARKWVASRSRSAGSSVAGRPPAE
jgi:CelD/BcsL family acetyltransferase involved in cellulose biosynthesis